MTAKTLGADLKGRVPSLLCTVALVAALPFACESSRPEGTLPERARVGQSLLSVPPLGVAASFSVLGGSTVTNTGASTIQGDLGVAPGLAITGFPPGLVLGGVTHAGGATALEAQTDVTAAYIVLAGDPCAHDLTGQDLGGLALTQGVYCFSSEAQLTGTLVLDARGDPDAVFVFQIGSTLTTGSNASVVLINGGQDCRAFWQIGSSATLGTGTVFAGSIVALTSVTLNNGARVSGRVFARNGAVTMDSNDVFAASCVESSDAGTDGAVGDARANPEDGSSSSTGSSSGSGSSTGGSGSGGSASGSSGGGSDRGSSSGPADLDGGNAEACDEPPRAAAIDIDACDANAVE